MGIFDSFKSKASELMDKAGDVAGDLTAKAKGGQAGDQAGDTTDQPGQPGQSGDMAGQARDRMGDMADQARDQASGMADRAGDMAKGATGGRFGDQIDQGVDIAKQRMGDADQTMRADADQQQS